MLITTMNDMPGYRIDHMLGEVFGLTVRSRHIGSQLGAAMKSLSGGELKGMTKNLEQSRQEAIDRLTQAAEALGANAIVAMRFDTTEMGSNWTEVCAYGTGCQATKL
ncbi:MAG: protein ybjQ [Pseudonocardia sp.]|jgi:uncharacterized protein YbjQ (UPF0145 family)|nr:protein ybjQ [Pseudonocardia sp.]